MLSALLKKKDLILIVVAVVCAVAGIYLAKSYIERVTGEYREKLDNQVRVVTVTRSLRKGELLTRDALSFKEVPLMFLPPRVVRYTEQSMADIVNRPVTTILEAGSILLWYNLDTELYSTIADVLERGQKALTLPVDAITGMSGLLRPRIRIDLYATFRESEITGGDEKNPALVAMRLFENVLLVAVGSDWYENNSGTRDASEGGYASVTIMVEESDVEKVLLAQELTRRQGTRIYCVLRSEMDAGAEKKVLPPVSQQEFFESLPKPEEAPIQRRVRRTN